MAPLSQELKPPANPGRFTLSDSGELAKYRVVHFATHAALGGRFEKDTEPSLILTPLAELSGKDDGYLTASEISQLKLDADWVILSACNTARSTTTYLESLTGLTQAFFYAGARSLLASNWEVESEATVQLVSHSVTEMTRDPTIGKAEAFRRSMVSLIEKGEMREAHPSVWAPFIVVGEGAALR